MRPEEIRALVSDCDATLNAIEDVLEDDGMSAAEKLEEIESVFYGSEQTDEDSDDSDSQEEEPLDED
jgi:HD-like signal output (HDOD) protein